MDKAPDYETFKGHDMIKIYTGGSYKNSAGETIDEYISFGVRKARAIVEHIDEIRKFAGIQEGANENTPF